MLIATAFIMAVLLSCAPLFQDVLLKLITVTSYIFWHNLFEFSSIIVSICVFCVSFYPFEQTRNSRYLFLGSMLLLMALIDFFHVMSFKGMPDFLIPYTTSNRATTFWIIARLIGGFGLLVSSIIPVRSNIRLKKILFFLVPSVLSIVILNIVTYHPGVIPPMYVEGEGLTEVKIMLEFVVMVMLLLAVFVLGLEYRKTGDRFTIVLSCALLVSLFSELSFTLYTDVYGIYNFIGHLLKFIAYFMVFRVTFIQNIRQPYLELSMAKDEIKNYADNLDKIVEQRTEQINEIHNKLLADLEYARGIQMSMIPKKLPNPANAEFEACYYPAERIGGDFYNVFPIDETKIGMYIGDASGHGVSAAMLTVFLNQSIKTSKKSDKGVKEPLPPSEVLGNLFSDFNQTDFASEVYIVMLYGVYDLIAREFTFASAGLNVSPMILSPGGEVSELVIKGFPICKLPGGRDPGYYNSTIKLNKGEKVLFYTDGLTDVENKDKEAYSEARLRALLQKCKNMNAPQLAKSITEHVFKFIGGGKLQDDITFFIMDVR
jgi:sigma-B regulation protein RsbU (phosphoserine phosphatase)